jgi:hypothetical protein
VRIAVRDEGCAPDEPHPSPQRPEEEHGRGLLLVTAVCRSWGAQDTAPGLLVWADLPRSPAADATGAAAARSDLGWGARKPPADGRGTGTEASWGTEDSWRTEGSWRREVSWRRETSWGTRTMGVPPVGRSRDRGRL